MITETRMSREFSYNGVKLGNYPFNSPIPLFGRKVVLFDGGVGPGEQSRTLTAIPCVETPPRPHFCDLIQDSIARRS